MSDEIKEKMRKAGNSLLDVGTLANLEISVFTYDEWYRVQITCTNDFSHQFQYNINKAYINSKDLDTICYDAAKEFYKEAIENLRDVIGSMVEEKYYHDQAQANIKIEKINNGEAL